MALPVEFGTVAIHGKWTLLNGAVATGSVHFTGGIVVRATQSKTIVLPSTFRATLDVNGEITVQLPATDDPDITPVGWAYTVSEVLAGFTRTYNINVPWNTVGTLELASLATLPEAASLPVAGPYVTRVNGLTGDVVIPVVTYGTTAGTAAQGNDSRIVNALSKVNDLSDLTSAPTARTNLGLGSVDNTSDIAKPVSTATQAALDAKAAIVRPTAAMARVSNMIYWGEPLAGMGPLTAAGSVNTLHDTTDKAIGSESAKTVTPGVAGVGCGFGVFNGAILPDLTGKEIVLWVKITGMANTPDFKFYVGNTSLNNSLHWTMRESGTYTWLRDGDWWRVTLPFGLAVTTGVSPPLNTLDSWQIKAFDNGVPLTLQFGGFGYMPRQTKWPNGVVTIRFDDLLKTQITTAAPYMARYGFAATSYVIAETLYNNASGQFGGNYANLAQAHALEDLFGWEHASHADKAAVHNQTVNQGGTSTIGYTAYPAAAQLADMRACQLYLRQQGFRATEHFAWPQGAWDATSRLSAQQVFSSATTTKIINHETVPAADPYRLRCFSPTNTVTGAQLTAEVDKAIAGKQWLTILFHSITPSGAGSIETTTAAFNTLIDYLAAQNVPVRLASEVLDQRF